MSAPTKELRPPDLANQLFDAALAQHKSDPREAARQVIAFLSEALVHTILATSSDEATRRVMLKNIGEMIVGAGTPATSRPATSTPGKP